METTGQKYNCLPYSIWRPLQYTNSYYTPVDAFYFQFRHSAFSGDQSCLSVLTVCNVGVLWPLAKRLDGSRIQEWYGGRQGTVSQGTVLNGDPAPPRKGAQQPPLVGRCLLWPNGRPSQQLLSSCRLDIHILWTGVG